VVKHSISHNENNVKTMQISQQKSPDNYFTPLSNSPNIKPLN